MRPRGGIVDRVARGSAWTLSTRMTAMFCVFLANALAARELRGDPGAQFGVYTLATSIVATAAILAPFGCPHPVVSLGPAALAGDPAGAVPLLEHYLKLSPDGAQADLVQQALTEAKKRAAARTTTTTTVR